MEVHGGGTAPEVGPEDEGHHPTGDDEVWQESVVLVWWDVAAEVGGMHRIGYEPNWRDGGQVSLWNNIFSADAVFKRSATIPLTDVNPTGTTFTSGDGTCQFEYTDHAIWTISEEEVQAELHVTDAHTPVDIYPKQSTLGQDFAPNHMEVGGTVRGTCTIDGRRYDVDGLAFRDHGWGTRQWDTLLSHRWVAGALAPDFSFFAVSFHTTDDEIVGFGCVIREGVLIYAQVDIVAYLEVDGLTHRGGRVTMSLTTGETLVLECDALQKGAVSWIHGIACVDTMCRVTLGDRVGMCDFEMTNNALRGSHQPRMAIGGYVENGLHRLQ